MPFASSELITNPDGSIYHLHLLPDEVAADIITVGDTDRVDLVARHLDHIEVTKQNREFKTITGSKNGHRITIISTGIGTDNIDIVFNELDILANVNLATRETKTELTQLNFYRIGTSGTIRNDIAIDQLLISSAAVDMGNLSSYYLYQMDGLSKNIWQQLSDIEAIYRDKSVIAASTDLVNKFKQYPQFIQGITMTAPGFYAPQGRRIRLSSKMVDFNQLRDIEVNGLNVTNLEMETAGIYLLADLMGHNAISTNALLANRLTGEFSQNPQKTIETLIEIVVGEIVR